MSSQRSLGDFDVSAPSLDSEPAIIEDVRSEHVLSADAALDAMTNPTAIALDERAQRRAVHPCKQTKHPWRSPSWLAAALDSQDISYVADLHDVAQDVIRQWAHIYGHIDEPARNNSPALRPGLGGEN